MTRTFILLLTFIANSICFKHVSHKIISESSFSVLASLQNYGFGARIVKPKVESKVQIELTLISNNVENEISKKIESNDSIDTFYDSTAIANDNQSFIASIDSNSIDSEDIEKVTENVNSNNSVDRIIENVDGNEHENIERITKNFNNNELENTQKITEFVNNNENENIEIIPSASTIDTELTNDSISSTESTSGELLNTNIESIDNTVDINKIATTPTVEVEETDEDILKRRINTDNVRRSKRFEDLSTLQTQLDKSIARKSEIESLIMQEISSLKTNIFVEIENEKQNFLQLESIYKSFMDILLTKTSLLESENDLLVQLKNVRDKVKESTILLQLNEAVSKKEALITIEQNISDDLLSCVTDIDAELNDTTDKINALESVLDTLDAINNDNKDAVRTYSWKEVEHLQLKLYDSIQQSVVRDKKIKNFETIFNNLTKQKDNILGFTSIELSSSSIKQNNNNDDSKFSNSDSNKIINFEDFEDMKDNVRVGKLDTKELAEVLKKQNDQQFIAIAVEAIKKTDTSSDFLNSEDGKESKESFTSAVEAAKNFGNNISNLFNKVSTLWTKEVTEKSIEVTTTDEYLTTVFNGFKNVTSNEDIKNEFNNANKNTFKTTESLSIAAIEATKNINKRLKDSEKWNESVLNLKTSLSMLGVIVSIGAEKVLNATLKLDFQLPPSISKK